MKQMLCAFLLECKLQKENSIDSRNIITSILLNDKISDKEKKIFLSIYLNPNIETDLNFINIEYDRLDLLDDPWCFEEQVKHW